MAIEMSSDSVICCRCGMKFGRRKGNFAVSYASSYRGIGHLPICKECVETMYNGYLAQCNDRRAAVRQMCRKLDLFWSDQLFDAVSKKSATRSIMTQYVARINTDTYAGKSYDDTLIADGTLWLFDRVPSQESSDDTINEASQPTEEPVVLPAQTEPVKEDVIAFWGTGYTPSMYAELEQRRSYWMSRFPDDVELDIGTEAIIRQICSLELDINRDRAAGRAVDKSINALNTLLGSANLKPVQKKQDDNDLAMANTPLGVWLYRYENKRPLPDVYDDSKILKYVFTWMGHLCKMLGMKDNKYTKLYEEAIARYSVDKPEYDGDDDEAMLDALEAVSIDE